MNAQVTVVVVNFNGGDAVLAALESVEASTLPCEIVVVDNASSDASAARIAARFGRAQMIHNAVNRGFGAAANQGVEASKTPYVFLLNPDATIDPGALEHLVACARERPRCAAAGPLVLNPDGSPQPSRRAFPTLWQSAMHGLLGLFWPGNPGTRAYVLDGLPHDRASRVGWVSGSAMLVRKTAFDSVDGFDEDFFFFVEEVDLCRRLTDAGWEIWWEPQARVVHAWGASWSQRPIRYLWMHHRNLFLYATKHRRGIRVLAYPLIAAGLGLRFAALALRWLATRKAVPSHSGRSEGRV